MTTTVRVLNATGLELQIATRVQPALDSSDWHVWDWAVAPRAEHAVAIAQFDRDDGIARAKTWTFTSSFVVDGVAVSLEERVVGTVFGSELWQCMRAGDRSTGFVQTNAPRWLAFTGASGAVYELGWALSGFGFQDIQYTLLMAEPVLRRLPPVLPQIQTVVMLMLENRSFDTLLGWLYRADEPKRFYPPGSPTRFDGIPADAANDYHAMRYVPSLGTQAMRQPCRVPNQDPSEGLPHVKNQLYADAFGRLPNANPWAETPSMTGFVWDYDAFGSQNGEVMGAYTPQQLPALSGLARNYAVSDRWFASVPTQTDPNRAFSVCGTSLGAEVNSDLDGKSFATTNTVFNVLGEAGKTWGIYWQTDGGWAAGSPFFDVYTPYFFPRIAAAKGGSVAPYAEFLTRAREGTLPNFCYLEPKWGGGIAVPDDPLAWVGFQGNDYHPPAWIGPAEYDLNALFEQLVASPQWPNMLFIVTFDEHGGTWDHVPPPPTISPDARAGKSGFQFDRLGVRVPTLLISPYIPAGLVFRSPQPDCDYDHTSFIATMLRWAGVDPASANLGARVAAAPTFEEVFETQARSDVPVFQVPSSYAAQGKLEFAPMSPHHLASKPSRPLDVRAFRHACEVSSTPEELRDALGKLT